MVASPRRDRMRTHVRIERGRTCLGSFVRRDGAAGAAERVDTSVDRRPVTRPRRHSYIPGTTTSTLAAGARGGRRLSPVRFRCVLSQPGFPLRKRPSRTIGGERERAAHRRSGGGRRGLGGRRVRPRDEQQLGVAQVRDLADAPAGWVEDADLRAHVALERDRHRAHVPALGQQRDEVAEVVEPLVGAREHEPRAREPLDDPRQRVRGLAPPVERALRRPAVDALAGDAVVLGRVPADQRLPHVVVREVGVLVVRRVEVGALARRRTSSVSASSRVTVPAGPGTTAGSRSSSALNERGAHCFTYAIWRPHVESTRSAASSRLVEHQAALDAVRAPSRSISSRIASTRIPLCGWKNRARSQNVSVK